ncbi:carbohydrate ABC transporter permease [Paenibacillus radicis (ex Gao et al. 2016)]|uniref:Sugar ABC transporter permease n=1 Tax=Paenibacillus radicis (ex Gao et al. 2016) TaxID=1737354 RepID=A0A917H318_9BACL|nr:carbohydrate ABC transporter permease [Paenibacillus radicis (ex Gao et al. 2016)]GGG65809.1 sugar ABC transporter permease [Paenibacillus radicis (ex Gao et al. 2016)]
MNTRRSTVPTGEIILYAFMTIVSLLCIIPFVIILSSSMTRETDILMHGYNIFPKNFDFTAYRFLFQRMDVVLTGYKVTSLVTIIGTVASLIISAMIAYPISLRRLKYRRFISGYVLMTLLFNGGMVPWYIINVKYLHLHNNLWALILPSLVNGFNIFLMRNYFSSIPEEMHESAKIDGASEVRTLLSIIVPLSVPVFASVGLFIGLAYWNDWWLGLMLIDKTELQPLQLMLRTIVSNVDYLANSSVLSTGTDQMVPRESVKMAATIVTIGPIIFLYPFLQRYFVKGLMMGAVKG